MPSPYDNLRFSQSQFIPQYAGAPIEEFSKLLQNREASYQKNIADFDAIELAGANLNINDADYAVKKEALDRVRNTIQGIEDDGGAYEFAGSKVKQLARDFTGNQALKAAMENQATIEAKKKEYQDLYLGDKMSQVGYEEGLRRLQGYSGVGEGEEGIYNKPELYTPVKYTDYNTKLTAFGRSIKADMIDSGWQEEKENGVPTGWMFKYTEKGVEKQDIRDMMRDYAEADPDIMATVNEHQTITGEDILTKAIDAQAEALGYKQIKREITTNTPYLARQKNKKEERIGLTVEISQKVEGSDINSGQKYAATIQSIDKLNAQLLAEGNELSIDPYTNRARIAEINMDKEALKGRKEVLEAREKDIEARAFKKAQNNGKITRNITLDYYKQNIAEQQSGFKSEEEYIKQQLSGSDASNPMVYQGVSNKSAVEIEQEYQEFLKLPEGSKAIMKEKYQNFISRLDPWYAEKEKLWEEEGKSKVELGRLMVPEVEKTRKYLSSVVNSATGLGDINTGKSLGDSGVDRMALGLTWVGTKKDGENIDDKDAEKIRMIGEVGWFDDARSGLRILAFDVKDKDGIPLGRVSMSTPSLVTSIQQYAPDQIGMIIGPQLSKIRSSTTRKARMGYGKVFMDVEYVGHDLEAAKKGNYIITYSYDDNEEPIVEQVMNNIAVTEAFKNLYHLNNR